MLPGCRYMQVYAEAGCFRCNSYRLKLSYSFQEVHLKWSNGPHRGTATMQHTMPYAVSRTHTHTHTHTHTVLRWPLLGHSPAVLQSLCSGNLWSGFGHYWNGMLRCESHYHNTHFLRVFDMSLSTTNLRRLKISTVALLPHKPHVRDACLQCPKGNYSGLAATTCLPCKAGHECPEIRVSE